MAPPSRLVHFVVSLFVCAIAYKSSGVSLIFISIINNARYTLLDSDLTFADASISFFLGLPRVFPYAQSWVHDNEEGRIQINKDRKHFNSFVNNGFENKLIKLGMKEEKIQIPSSNRDFPAMIDVYLYKSAEATRASTTPSALYIWIHGGGFVYGEARDNLLLDGMPSCEGKDLIVASVEYRLPPEFRFPIPTDDTMDVLQHFYDHASDYGIDRGKISIGGTSAGANLAAVLGQRARDAGIQLKFQMMLVPALHLGCVTRSCLQNAHVPLLGAQEIVWFHNMYSNGFRDGINPHYNPLMYGAACSESRAVNFAPALIVTAKKDALRDDGRDYVAYLNSTECRVPVTHLEVPGTHWSIYQNTKVYLESLQQGIC